MTDLTEKLVQWFDDAESVTYDARQKAERDRDYYDNKQWTDAEIKELNKRKQPVVTINRIKRKIDALKGIERQQRTDPKAFPRNPDDEDSANAATDAIRFVVENNNYDQVRSNYWENLLIEGMGAVKVYSVPARDDIEIRIRRVPWDRFFYDPHSHEHDFSDAKYLGEVIWMDLDDAKRKWPDRKDAISATMAHSVNSETYDDRPKFQTWADQRRKRIRIVQMRWQDANGWRITTFTKGGVLKDGPSPYVDENGDPESDLIAASAFIDRDNNRYGAVREMVSPQDEINKRRSKALHLMSVRQSRVEPGSEAGQMQRKIRSELAKPDGVVEARAGEFEILDNGDMATAQFSLLQEAKNEIDMMGPNPSLQGKEDRQLSGRALLAQQQAGLVELAPLLDRKRDMDIRVYRAVWNRIRQFWTEERWIRVTDDEKNLKFVGLNRAVTVGEQLEKEFGGIPPQFEGSPLLNAQAQENGQPIIENSVAEMDVDIILDEGPDSITLQAEQFEQLTQLAGAGLPIPPELIIEASSLRNKDILLEKLQGGEMTPEQQQMQQMIQQLQMRDAMAEVMKKEAEAAKTGAEVQKTGAETLDEQASAEERASQILLNMAKARGVA